MRRKVLVLVLLGLAISAGCVHRVMAQSRVPAPFTKPQWFDNSGNPLNGGLLYTYISGTTNPKATYTAFTAGSTNANPVVLDSAGRADVWLGPGAYRLVLKTSAGVTLWTEDGVAGNDIATGGWTYDGTSKIYPSSVNTDVLVGSSTAADCCTANGRLEVVGAQFRILSDNTANSNMLVERVDNTAITFEERLNGGATHVPMLFRDGGKLAMNLDGTGTGTILTIGSAALLTSNAAGNGLLNLNGSSKFAAFDPTGFSLTSTGSSASITENITDTPTAGITLSTSANSSATYTAQGVTSNSIITTSGYFGTATAADTFVGNRLPFYLKQASGTFAVFADTAGSTGSLVLVTSSTSGTFFSGTTAMGATLHNNATGNSPVITIETVTSATTVGLGGGAFPSFVVVDAINGVTMLMDATSNAATTGLMVWHNGALQRVGLNAADSCGAGFRCLRVNN